MTAPDLGQVRQFLEAAVVEFGVRTGEVEWQFGISILPTCERWRYWATPLNSVTFATTGGDGVHFGTVPVEGKHIVVMTAPAEVRANVVVGESLKEFLRLGYYRPLDWLGALPEQWDEIATEYCRPEPRTAFGQQFLERLRATFELTPVADLRTHLEELQGRYLRHVEVAPFE